MKADERIEGTAPFMAPEQVTSAWGRIGRQTDVYGLGAVFYTLLTGHPPWRGKRLADVLAQVISAQPALDPCASRSEIPQPLADICLRCLAKQPAARYATASELEAALARLSI